MSESWSDPQLFFEADTITEAVERIYAITGRSPDNSRGEKRALLALRDALDLDVDVVRTNAVLGQALADELHVEWDPSRHTYRNRVTLTGLNVLLEGAAAARQEGALHQLRDATPETLSGPAWDAFKPARSKIEAVTRIAAITDAPKEWLGPGGKEHRSVLVNLADRLLPDGELNRSSKTRLAAALADAFGVPWSDKCESTGETISLQGLNTLLAGAERYAGVLGTEIADVLATPEEEGDALAASLLAKLPPYWDGRKSVKWLAAHELRGAHDNEWQGFYGEEQAKLVLSRSFTPPTHPVRVKYGHTIFDYALNRVWDIKVHTELKDFERQTVPAAREMLLNDERAVRACVAEQGLGFLVISGSAYMDESGEFVAWHRNFKARRTGRPPAPSNSGNSRARKAGFDALHVESFWVPNTHALDAAVLSGALKVRPIGRQPPKAPGQSGAPRAHKFAMHLPSSREQLRVARYSWSKDKW